VVAQAEENLRVTNERFKEGVALNSEVLEAETALLQARTGHTQALVDLELAKAGLAKAVGE
jgi:outer membrane protein TolC